MKFFAAFILTAFLSYVGGLYADWWIIAVVAFLVSAIIPQKPFFAFLAGFFSLFLLWTLMASYMDVKNKHLLSTKIAEVLFKAPSHWLIMMATGLVAGLVGGFAALTGSFIRKKAS
ncbi:MAG: hypothetical protein K2X48_17135 [Chitinophagaceae bacterium]|nr:hypothetical protein [Chitinophagaceae bacterium]